MSSPSIHHINYLVKDLQQSIPYFSSLFQQDPIFEPIASRGVITARYDLSGIYFILVQPSTEQGLVAETLANKGEGLFLLSLSADDLDSAITDLEHAGVAVDHASRRSGLHNWQVCDLISTIDAHTTIQICQDDNE